ncbi:MAG TPA: cytochrome c [Thermoanaerobaculia bacterium]|nr:cytochrome c [Thermoanaerobaculia bacterium]
MRYTKVGTASYLIAFFLIGAAVLFAFWRSRPSAELPSRHAGDATVEWRSRGADLYATECAGCHSMSEFSSFQRDVALTYRSPGGREYLARLLLDGNLRVIENGEVSLTPGHPPFDHLTNDEIAGILEYMLADAHSAGDGRYTAPEIESLRGRP